MHNDYIDKKGWLMGSKTSLACQGFDSANLSTASSKLVSSQKKKRKGEQQIGEVILHGNWIC